MDNNLNQQLDEKLRQSYQQLSAKAPEGLWERLQEQLPEDSSALDQAIDEKVQQSYEQFSAIAPVGIWEQLDKALPPTEETLDQVLDDKLDDKIKEGFTQQLHQTAPLALWAAISEELPQQDASIDEALDEKIKSSYEEEQLHVPQKVWLAVNRQLNIDRTWQRISAALDTPASRFDWKLRGLQLSIVLLSLLLWARTCEVVPPKPIPPATKEPVAVVAQPASDEEGLVADNNKTIQEGIPNQQEAKNIFQAAQGLGKAVPQEGEETTNTSKVSTATAQQQNREAAGNSNAARTTNKGILQEEIGTTAPYSNIILNREQTPLFLSNIPDNKENSTKNSLSTFSTNTQAEQQVAVGNEKQAEGQDQERFSNSNSTLNYSTAFLASNFLQELSLPSIVPTSELELTNAPEWKNNYWGLQNRLAVGVFTAVNSTVLLNNETREGFDYNSLTTNYFGLAANYGLWARYRLSDKGALVAEYSINADHRQAYGIFRKGQYIIKEYVFKYNRVSLAYQFDLLQLNRGRGINNKVTAQVGGYVGAMRAARVYYDNVLVNDRITDYHDFDWGAKLTLGHEIVIDHFVIGYGFRSDVGIANIFKGNQRIGGQDNQTNLIHLGGYFQLGYQF